jgi:hypothetical protein
VIFGKRLGDYSVNIQRLKNHGWNTTPAATVDPTFVEDQSELGICPGQMPLGAAEHFPFPCQPSPTACHNNLVYELNIYIYVLQIISFNACSPALGQIEHGIKHSFSKERFPFYSTPH